MKNKEEFLETDRSVLYPFAPSKASLETVILVIPYLF